METINITGTGDKVYNFDKKKFPKIYIPWLFLLLCIYVCTAFICFLMSYLVTKQALAHSASIFILIMPATYAIGLIISFFRERSTASNNTFEFSADTTSTACLHKYGNAYEAESTIHSIQSVKRTPFSIIVRGDIQILHHYYEGRSEPDNLKRKRLRIPAYFENMDEIYASLSQLKEQTDKKERAPVL